MERWSSCAFQSDFDRERPSYNPESEVVPLLPVDDKIVRTLELYRIAKGLGTPGWQLYLLEGILDLGLLTDQELSTTQREDRAAALRISI